MATCLRVTPLLFSAAFGQQAGMLKTESPLYLPLYACSGFSCVLEDSHATLDANWRWLHDASPDGYQDCYGASGWNLEFCPDAVACAKNCAYDGVDEDDYYEMYGVQSVSGGLNLKFQTEDSTSSRLYVMDSPDTYKLFYLKNREFAFDMDLSSLGCGLNAAVYFVGMDKHGWKGMGDNNAGARFGMGYCDAQCRYDMKFVGGSANLGGEVGSCCTELDIFEGNRRSLQMSMHPCDDVEPLGCVGEQCGDNADGNRYAGVCDKDGCDFNAWRMGFMDFFAPSGAQLDSSRPFTVVTQFVTGDGTDAGELTEIRRFYVQDGERFDNPTSTLGSSISDDYCKGLKQAFPGSRTPGQDKGDFDQFTAKGGMSQIGKALDRGLVLVLSIWDDPESNMVWLDSDDPVGLDPEKVAGVRRGPCSSELNVKQVEKASALSSVSYTNIRYGDIGSTQGHISVESMLQKVDASTGSVMQKADASTGSSSSKRRLPAAMPLVAALSSFASVVALGAFVGRQRRNRRRRGGSRRETEVNSLIGFMGEDVENRWAAPRDERQRCEVQGC